MKILYVNLNYSFERHAIIYLYCCMYLCDFFEQFECNLFQLHFYKRYIVMKIQNQDTYNLFEIKSYSSIKYSVIKLTNLSVLITQKD